MMIIRKLEKLIAIILLGATIFAIGCASQSNSSPTPSTSKPAITPQSPSTTKPNSTPQTTTSRAPTSTTPSAKPKTYSAPPAMQIDTSKKYVATVETTLGSFKIQLLPLETPKTVNNFVFLSREGFYNGVIFHRIIKTFMIQTGDPLGTGGGGPGYRFADELPPKHKYDPGIVAMANAGVNTNGSQFFICTGSDASGLNNMPNYTQFGQVIEGMDVVQKIASVPVVSNGREVSKPVDPPVIKSIVISEQ